jgi:putative aldouronate transport system permease protein
MIMSRGRRAYQWIINLILLGLTACMLLPMALLFMSSITEEKTLVVYGYSLLPKKFSLAAYHYIVTNASSVFRAYGITVVVTLTGTAGTLLLTSLTAFPLSLRNLPGRNIITFFVFFTMLFSGGLVPAYIMWTTVFHIKNTLWAYILPNFLLSAFNIILVRTYFQANIPPDIYDAAKIDGAGYLRIYGNIALPLGKPILVAISLFAGLGYWNDWTNGLYYISDSRLLSIQALLNRMIQDIQALMANTSASSGALMQIPQVSIRMAIAFVAVLPILAVYPFLQKYFESGIMLGAVKG